VLTPLQHSDCKERCKKRSKHGSCQRIMLTPLQHSAPC
jgi:hypothetical protein